MAWVAAELAEDVEIVGVYHSHPFGRAVPSDADRVDCERQGLPYVIYATPADEWCVLTPSGFVLPLYGRSFVHGVVDCYTFVRDWYRAERGLELPDFEREDNWWDRGQNLYLDNLQACGFEKIELADLRPGDALLIEHGVKRVDPKRATPNHAVIYLGGGLIAHHPPRDKSRKDPYVVGRGYLARHTICAVRPPSSNPHE